MKPAVGSDSRRVAAIDSAEKRVTRNEQLRGVRTGASRLPAEVVPAWLSP